VRGRFRSDLELARGAAGTVRLKRKRGARLFSLGLSAASLAAAGVDLIARRPWIAAAQLSLALAFAALLAGAELDSWRFDGEQLVRRTFSLRRLRFREVRLGARSIRTIGVARGRGRARAWVETRSGQQYALVEGEESEVDRIAEDMRRALQLAALHPAGSSVH